MKLANLTLTSFPVVTRLFERMAEGIARNQQNGVELKADEMTK